MNERDEIPDMNDDDDAIEHTAAHRALWNIADLHRPRRLEFEPFSVCMECAGSPEWPCETVRIIQEVVKDDLTFAEPSPS